MPIKKGKISSFIMERILFCSWWPENDRFYLAEHTKGSSWRFLDDPSITPSQEAPPIDKTHVIAIRISLGCKVTAHYTPTTQHTATVKELHENGSFVVIFDKDNRPGTHVLQYRTVPAWQISLTKTQKSAASL